ncbi:cytochrome c oxidase subunit II [Sphingomonas panacisoli]|uniref:Cytochrome aa3 subunit 2 n=1 Tax=Sphingomonas panacisoli TaxID=1813879 RepID=A0A5B8LGV2_9SPHN|nr:cytochrome c oxidase subunit II [Sphingomonas panacisoli]QDZ06872.1 cytochrome c oxidase subunit II [Sphingomonas panacisoli]
MTGAPLGYLISAGTRAATIVPLTWFLTILSVVVCAVIGALLWFGVGRARGERAPVERRGDGLGWIRWGLALSALPMAVTLIWTMAALGRVVGPPRDARLTIDVTARQYWWEVRYADAAGSFVTANEIHIPTDTKVVVRLHGPDVIHSFWVPQLSGKTDVIPGQINVAWLEASRPGRYRGQCSEYCGLEHAQMAFEVVAERPDQFAAWRAGQQRPIPLPATPDAQRGLVVFKTQCAQCHALRGVGGGSGPDLTHLMSRAKIAAGTLDNTTGNLAGWILDPQSAKPGSKMPAQPLDGRQLNDLLALLKTLK